MPAPRWRPTASISSMKMMQGEFCFACSKRSRTRLAPTPTNISTKSQPEIEKKGPPPSPARARGRRRVAGAGGTGADEHLDEARAGDREEGHAGLAGDGAGEQRLAGPGRSI